MNNLEHALSVYAVNYGRINRDDIVQIIERKVASRELAEGLYDLCKQEITLLREDLLLFQYGKRTKPDAVNAFRRRLNQPVDEKVVEQAVQLAEWLVAKS